MERIERYILKEMPPEEYDAFTRKITEDAVPREKVSSVQLMLVGIQESILSEKLDDFHQGVSASRYDGRQAGGGIFPLKRWLAAASVVILIGVSVVVFLSRPGKSEELFTEYYKPDTGLITAMSTSENYLFDHAMIDYKTKQYDSAIKTWKDLLQTNPSGDTLNYFIGSAFLAKGNSDSAVTYLDKVVIQSGSNFYQDACWYLGLALLKQGKTGQAIAYIEKSDHPDKDALLNRLKK